MPKITLNKMDTARRQIDAAVRMTFAGEDPVAIHSVASAGNRIVRDLSAKRGDIESYLRFTDWIKTGYEKQFWKAFNASANFIKHADDDPDAIFELDDEASDFLIVFTSKWYRDLGNATTRAMNTFMTWWALQHEEFVNPALIRQFERVGVHAYTEVKRAMVSFDRKRRLEAGQLMLSGRKSAPI
jgi:hypothetical protein